MKKCRKIDGYYVCEECGKLNKSCASLSLHLTNHHKNISKEEYSYKWLKEKIDGHCVICGNDTLLINFNDGYKNCCSETCTNKFTWNCIEESNLRKHGVKSLFSLPEIREKSKDTLRKNFGENIDHPFQIPEVLQKIEQTILKKYGVKNISQNEDIKKQKIETCLKNNGFECGLQNLEKRQATCKLRYGYEFPSQCPEIRAKMRKTIEIHIKEDPGYYVKIANKIKQTNFERCGEFTMNTSFAIQKGKDTCRRLYNVDSATQLQWVKDKIMKTNIERHGYPWPMQNKQIFEKACRSAKKFCKFKDTDLIYQASYEKDFLDKYFNRFYYVNDLYNGPSVEYLIDENDDIRVYHSDFFIPSLNLVVEIKSDYYYNDIINPFKKEAVINAGYNYIMILNKNYTEFNKLIS